MANTRCHTFCGRGFIMKKQKRRLFFYFLTIIFFLAAPVIIGYSLGYTFNFTNGAVEQTGGIFIKSRIPNLSIFLDGTFIKATSFIPGGALLPEVSPGTHIVRIEKAGFSSWSKTVAVKPSLVIEFRNIVLVPAPVPLATSTKEELQQIKIIENGDAAPGAGYKLDKKNNLLRTVNGITRIIATNVHSFSPVGNIIFFVDKNGFLARYSPVTDTTETVGRPGFFLSNRPLILKASPAGDIGILDAAGGFFLLDTRNAITSVESGVQRLEFDRNGDKVLLVKEHELKILWMRDNPYQPFGRAGTKETIFKTGERLSDAHWFYQDNAHVVFSTNAGVFLLETDGRGGLNTVELFSEPVEQINTYPDLPNSIFIKRGKTTYTVLF